MNATAVITCPECGKAFPLEAALAEQYEQKLNEAVKTKTAAFEAERQAQDARLREKEKELAEKASKIDVEIAAGLEAGRAGLKKIMEEQAQKDFESRLAAKDEELTVKSKELQQLRETQIENERLKRALQGQEQELALQFERKMTERLNEEAGRIRQREQENVALVMKEKDKKLEDLNARLAEAMRRAEQGSIQLQGEVQELALGEMLREQFPHDGIADVAKGARGADLIQTVMTSSGTAAGTIIYESKRTKHFSEDWIAKLKADAITAKADLMIIVTEAMPGGAENVMLVDGVWICRYPDVRSLALVLRESLLMVHRTAVTQANKGDKMQMLYDYFTGNEFRMQLEAIVEGFRELREGYEKEKLQAHKTWKEREKQIERIQLNTIHMYGSIKGIAGSSVPEIQMLEGGDK